jgi:hypothetical protein
MDQFTRLTVTAAVTITLVGLLVLAGPGALGRLGINVDDLPGLLQRIQGERARGAEIDTCLAAVAARGRATSAVVRELIDGKVSLLRAAARVRDLYATDPNESEWLLTAEGNSDGERLCRRVIGWAEAMLRDTPERGATVAARLERELEQWLQSHGTVVLPR